LISVNVKGAPYIPEFKSTSEIIVKSGNNVDVEIPFCSDQTPSVSWIIHLPGSDENKISLSSGTRYGRFSAEIEIENGAGQHCYQAVLRIMGAHPSDTNTYVVEIQNDEGGVKKTVNISVIDDSPKIEFLIAIIVGSILTILLLTLVILYAVKANSCMAKKKCKSEAISSHTDTESCHSNLSCGNGKKAIPPDAVYWDSIPEVLAIRSKSDLKPDVLNLYSKTLNPFSASDKLKRREYKSQGLACQLNSSQSATSEISL
jgi:hypothetical protein